jgi:hypothetical protein
MARPEGALRGHAFRSLGALVLSAGRGDGAPASDCARSAVRGGRPRGAGEGPVVGSPVRILRLPAQPREDPLLGRDGVLAVREAPRPGHVRMAGPAGGWASLPRDARRRARAVPRTHARRRAASPGSARSWSTPWRRSRPASPCPSSSASRLDGWTLPQNRASRADFKTHFVGRLRWASVQYRRGWSPNGFSVPPLTLPSRPRKGRSSQPSEPSGAPQADDLPGHLPAVRRSRRLRSQ